MNFSIAVTPVVLVLVTNEIIERGVIVRVKLAAGFEIVAEDLFNELGADPLLFGELKGTQGR